jgi:class 3 adenylate cyclase
MSQEIPPQVLAHLLELTKEVARGEYDRAQELFDLTRHSRDHGPLVEDLAEAFGMMMVQVEGREFRLERLIAELKETNQRLEETLAKVRLLEGIQGHLAKFVPQSVARLIQKNPEAPDLAKRQRDVSVLFLDVAGYTRLSEQVEPERMNHLIESYFSAFLDDIHKHGGDINETAGDGLMILFQQEEPAENAREAVATARAIQGKVHRINREQAGEPIAVNVGINSGPCQVGSTCFHGVSGDRWTYTASGPVTNLAARLGGLATGGRVLVGPDTRRRVESAFPLADLGEHRLKNVSRPVRVFELVVEGGPAAGGP